MGTSWHARRRTGWDFSLPGRWGMRLFLPGLDLDVSILFEPVTLRDVTVRNRIWMAAMCQYSAAAEGPDTGAPTPWHATHLHSRAVGGVGAVIVEATAVSAEGRISPHDLGLWNDRQREAFAPITAQVASAGATPGIQLAHAGRKASTYPPFVPERGSVPVGAGQPPALAPSAVPFADYAVPAEMTPADIDGVVADFAASARVISAGTA